MYRSNCWMPTATADRCIANRISLFQFWIRYSQVVLVYRYNVWKLAYPSRFVKSSHNNVSLSLVRLCSWHEENVKERNCQARSVLFWILGGERLYVFCFMRGEYKIELRLLQTVNGRPNGNVKSLAELWRTIKITKSQATDWNYGRVLVLDDFWCALTLSPSFFTLRLQLCRVFFGVMLQRNFKDIYLQVGQYCITV